MRLPIQKAKLLSNLDDLECSEGYIDGLKNEPKPNDNRSYSYWHGWRNGMVDGGHSAVDKFQKRLAKDFMQKQK